ncbi:MAG: 2,3-butanediol dehydrogenase [Deltaproteobacteria bacterium]|nr:2,3-butanediol dehydrogenase [Deltaproteobacteria bacterium]
MRAARWYAPRDLRIEALAPPQPGAGEVLVRVEWCGLCGTDVHEYTHGPVLIPSRPHPLTGRVPPITLGHEFCGTVVSAAAGFAAGERVTANACLVCHQCAWCRAGQPNLCAKLGSIGLCADGGLAEFVNVPAYSLYRLPAGMPAEVGALAEPTAVAVHACRRARLKPGETVAVVGAGTIGLLVLQAARAGGAAEVFSIEPIAARRQLAEELGARLALDPAASAVDKEIAAATDNRRADVVFECTGSLAGIETALRVSGKAGRVAIVGIYRDSSPAPWARLQAHEKEIIGSSAYTDEFPEALRLLASDAVRGAALITDRIDLAELEARGLRALLEEPAKHLKILVQP